MNAYNKYLTILILFFITFISINGYDNYAHNNYKSTPHIIHQTRAPEANNSQWNVSFSCNNNPFPHNRSWDSSHYHKSEDPKYYTAKDFSNYFSHGYSEKEILVEHRHLYLYDEFVTFAKTLPEYQETIVKLHHELKGLSRAKKFLYILNGAYWPGLDKRIKELFEEIKKNPQKSIATSSYTMPMGYCAISAFQDALPSYNILRPLYNDYNPYLSQAIDNRTRAYDTAVKNKMAVKTVAYDIDDNMQKLLQKYEHAIIPLTSCTGDDLMQCIHQESLDILEQVTYLSYNSILLDHREALVDIAVAMNEYNHEKETTTALNIADFCWTLLDYGQAVGEGIALGLYSAVTDIINNPVATALNLVVGQELLAYQLCKVAYNVTDIGITAMYDYNGATKKWNTYIEPINNLIEMFKSEKISGRDVVKNGVALFVQCSAQNRLLGGLGKFCGTVKKKAIDSAKNKIFKKPQTYVATPEGMLCKATAEFNKTNPAKPSNLKDNIYNKISKTVWDNIKMTDAMYPGTKIPKSFELKVGKQKFWICPNSTEHMMEYIIGKIKTNKKIITHSMPMNCQSLLTSFQAAVEQAVSQGIKYDTMINIGCWQLRFGMPRSKGLLPTIYHANFKPKSW